MIGEALGPAAQFIEGFRDDMLTPLAQTIRETIGDPVLLLQDTLFDVFGPTYLGGLGLLLDSEGNPTSNI